MQMDLAKLRAEYRRLQRTLGQTGWLSHGYVQDRGPGAGGPCYQWTRKESKKTVSVALSKEQYAWMKAAIENLRQVQATLLRMEKNISDGAISNRPRTIKTQSIDQARFRA